MKGRGGLSLPPYFGGATKVAPTRIRICSALIDSGRERSFRSIPERYKGEGDFA